MKERLIKNRERPNSLGIDIMNHDKLPDVVLYSEDRNWLFFIEAVTNVGPMSMKRMSMINEMSKGCSCGKIFVTAFPNKSTYKKFVEKLAWETEIWIAEIPDHMIHLNGDRFIGPR